MIHVYLADISNNLVEVTRYVNLQTPGAISLTCNAEEASVATSTQVFEDASGLLTDVVGLRRFVVEDDAASFRRIFSGYVWDKHVRRGHELAGASARNWNVEVNDLNTILSWRVIEGNGSRPAETDVQRMQWLVSTTYITSVVTDVSTYLDTSSPVNMDAADYSGQYVSDLINDCMQASTKNCYLLDEVTAGVYGYAIWYGAENLTTFSSAIKISNILSEVDGSVTFAPNTDAELARSPSRVFSGVRVNYDGGFTYRTDAATATTFNATRDTIYDQPNIKSSTVAQARGDTQLALMDTEEDVITCTILVPAAHVNDVRAGMRIQAKFSHFPDYNASYTWMRVLNRTVTLIVPSGTTGPQGYYEIGLTLSPQPPSGAGFLLAFIAYTGNTGAGVPVDSSTHTWTQLYNASNAMDPSVWPRPCGAGGGPGVQTVSCWYRAVVPGETATVAQISFTASGFGGMWVYQLADATMASIAAPTGASPVVVPAQGDAATISAAVSGTKALFSCIGWGGVGYDAGWCANGLAVLPILSTTAGTEIVNASSLNGCQEGAKPWMWQALATGSGTLTTTCQTLASGYGTAYQCGWNTAQIGVTFTIGAGFGITQRAFGGTSAPGGSCQVILPAPP